MGLEEFRPRHAEDEHRDVGGARGELFQQRHHRGLRPLHVIDHRDERRAGGYGFHVVPHRPGDLPFDAISRGVRQRGVGRFEPEHDREPCAHGWPLRVRTQQLAQPPVELSQRALSTVAEVNAGVLLQHLDQRPIRDAASVGQAPTAQNPGARRCRTRERFVDQA